MRNKALDNRLPDRDGMIHSWHIHWIHRPKAKSSDVMTSYTLYSPYLLEWQRRKTLQAEVCGEF